MDMDMDMSMDMDMGTPGLPSDEWFAKTYWWFVVGAVAFGTVVNIKEQILYRQRLDAASKSLQDPARPKNLFWRCYATATAIVREACYYQAPFLPMLQQRFPRIARTPPLGRLVLIAVNILILISMVFYGFHPQDPSVFESIGYRSGWMTASQVPLIFLLAGKRNIIGFLTGVSYERLNWIHRWVARCLFITATIHFAYWLKDWERWDYVAEEIELYIQIRRGLAAWCILLWIVLSSFAPSRWFSYEFFVVQHIITAAGFIAAIMFHTPTEVHAYIWIPVGLWCFDRTVRTSYMLYNNLSIFHPRRKDQDEVRRSSVLACKAVFRSLPDRATKITIPNPPFTWQPGQHAFVSCHTLVPLQSHPFTITTLPSEKSLEFIIRAHSGATNKFHRHASESLPPVSDVSKTVFIDGPYGRIRPLEQFDSVVLVAGSTGASYTIPLFKDLARRKLEGLPVVTRKVRFVWVIKRKAHISWFVNEIGELLEKGRAFDGLEVEASVYITCDDSMTAEIPEDCDFGQPTQVNTAKIVQKGAETKITKKEDRGFVVKEACGKDGRCCCQDVVDNEDIIVEDSRNQASCCCGTGRTQKAGHGRPNTSASNTSSSTGYSRSQASSLRSSLDLPKGVHLLTGRPAVRNVIKKELEQALGESAVVVCGPIGLVNSTREAVVSLSDERAVHKGTGAQGIYLHTESFTL